MSVISGPPEMQPFGCVGTVSVAQRAEQVHGQKVGSNKSGLPKSSQQRLKLTPQNCCNENLVR